MTARRIDDEAKNGKSWLVHSRHYGWFEARYDSKSEMFIEPNGTLTLAEQVTHYAPLPGLPPGDEP